MLYLFQKKYHEFLHTTHHLHLLPLLSPLLSSLLPSPFASSITLQHTREGDRRCSQPRESQVLLLHRCSLHAAPRHDAASKARLRPRLPSLCMHRPRACRCSDSKCTKPPSSEPQGAFFTHRDAAKELGDTHYNHTPGLNNNARHDGGGGVRMRQSTCALSVGNHACLG